MKTLHGFSLGKELRALSDSASERCWIVSPYIGKWPAVTALLGDSWWRRAAFDLRVITDLSEISNVSLGTLSWLSERGQVRSLPGVHAKIYIFDDKAIVTSANLTETAFTKRREIGILLSAQEATDTITTFAGWWKDHAQPVTDANRKEFEACRKYSGFPETETGASLKPLWDLPPKPDLKLFTNKGAAAASLYGQFLQHYCELAEIYESEQRLWKNAPLYLEVDAFLNFLYHEEDRPSERFKAAAARHITAAEREKDLRHYAKAFAAWLKNNPGEKAWRMERLETVKNLLAKDRIEELDRKGVVAVLDCIHAMGALPWPKAQFLDSPQNKLGVIRRAWKELLFGSGNEDERIQRCQDLLYNFGSSSTQELLGCFYPEKYPLKNTNTDAGLRFFGYPA